MRVLKCFCCHLLPAVVTSSIVCVMLPLVGIVSHWIPVGVEIAQKGNVTFSGSREAMLQAVDAMLQTSKKAIEQVPYHKSVLAVGETMLEILNPRYAEEKRQSRTITELEKRQNATDQKLDSILAILQKLDSPSTKS